MIREILIFFYLLHVRIWFNIFSLFPQRKKTVLISSFGDNIWFVADKVSQQTNHEIIILDSSNKNDDSNDFVHTHSKQVKLNYNMLEFIKGLYHLATAQVIFTDNYDGLLAGTKFKHNVYCVQLWHANGAIKQFGLRDPSITNRSQRAYNRFKLVYNRFTHITVGSEKMADIFKEAFQINSSKFLYTGIPRTDLFFDEEKQQEAIKRIEKEIPSIQNKKTLLYAPTFRENELRNHQIAIDIQTLYEELNNDYALLLRLHPAIINSFKNDYPDFVVDVSDTFNINELLLVTDTLITDYSSIPFEYSLLDKPMIFYPYDLEQYTNERGFWEDYEELIPGPMAFDTEQIIDIIKTNDFNSATIQAFSQNWNRYNDGQASQRLIDYIYSNEDSK